MPDFLLQGIVNTYNIDPMVFIIWVLVVPSPLYILFIKLLWSMSNHVENIPIENAQIDCSIMPSQTKSEEATSLIKNLYLLRQEGAISESEYNLVKWDILSKNLLPRV